METKGQKKVSFIIPCYRSALTVGQVVSEIKETMSSSAAYTYEIILVDDGSPDATWERIRELSALHAEVRGYRLSRNFGQHAAIMAGLAKSDGDVAVCLDDDGQTPADEAPKLLDAIENGADAVYARYDRKQHSVFRNFGSAMNDRMTRVMLGKPKELYVSSYFALRRYVVEEMLRYTASYPYVIGLVLRTTRNIVNVDVRHRKRETGESGYTLVKLLTLWINGFTAFSVQPLRLATFAGVILACGGFFYGIYTIIKRFVLPDVPAGFSALMSAVLFIGGMLMVMVGMVGEYVGRTYIAINSSPQYVIRESTKDDGR